MGMDQDTPGPKTWSPARTWTLGIISAVLVAAVGVVFMTQFNASGTNTIDRIRGVAPVTVGHVAVDNGERDMALRVPVTDPGARRILLGGDTQVSGAAREVFDALVRRIKETGRYDPVTETTHALTQSIPLASGTVSESIVTARPALVQLRSTSRRALRSLTPVLQRALLARCEPATTVAEPTQRAGWVFPADEPISAVLVADGRVYASSHAEVHALGAATGALRWSRALGGNRHGEADPGGRHRVGHLSP